MQLTVQDLSKLINVPEKTIHHWIQEGEIPVHRVRSQYRFNRAEVLEWAISKGVQIAGSPFQESGTLLDPISLAAALETGGVFHGVEGTDKESVLRSVVDLMRLPDGMDRGFLVQMILAREELASTAVGEGIAIPHVRGPIVLQVPDPQITLCFLKTPITFGALDGLPVHILFTLVSPTTRAHLQLLSRLAFSLRDEGFKRILKKPGSAEEILREARRSESRLISAKKPTGSEAPGR
ncbi:MAG: PTS sugar transporter subunit IIA [bacterium]